MKERVGGGREEVILDQLATILQSNSLQPLPNQYYNIIKIFYYKNRHHQNLGEEEPTSKKLLDLGVIAWLLYSI